LFEEVKVAYNGKSIGTWWKVSEFSALEEEFESDD